MIVHAKQGVKGMDGMKGEYRPVDCDVHDKLESLATLKQPAEIIYDDRSGSRKTACDLIVDVYTEGDAEWLRLESGQVIRLDQVRSVDGKAYGSC
jgi:Rho-binding antiterminator